uniref:Uncharacterized protein n=2 Tax=Bursaphelenchus xylophilus TaxID=6326 RepID=A0A1I7SWB3_BURXY
MEQFSEPIPLNPPRWRKNGDPSSDEKINRNEKRDQVMTTTVTTASRASPTELTATGRTLEPRLENLLAPLMDEPEPSPIAPLFHQVHFRPQESTVVQNVPPRPQNHEEYDPNRQGYYRQFRPQGNQDSRYPIQAYQKTFSFPPHQPLLSHPIRRPMLAPTYYQPNNRSRIEPKIYQQLYTDPQFGPTLALNIQFPTPTKGCAPGCQPQCTVQCIERGMDGITVTATEARSFFQRRFSKQGINRQVKSNQIMFTNPKAVDPDDMKFILDPQNDAPHSPMTNCVPECTRVCKRECLKQDSGVLQCYKQCNQECMARCPERTD